MERVDRPDHIGLRIDVDFACDLFAGVPFMLDALGRHAMKATFFVNVGGQAGRPGRWFARLLDRDYRERYWRLGPWRILSRMGPASVRARGDRLRRCAPVLRRIVAEGHELGLHGYDHTWWADQVWSASPSELEDQVRCAQENLRSVTGTNCLLWASPAWRTTDHVVALLHRIGAPYLSECWGRGPFVTVTGEGVEIPVPHLPITMPSLETLRLTQGKSLAAAVRGCLEARSRGGFDVVCMHGYYEGLLEREAFPLFLEECRKQGTGTVTLGRMKELVEISGKPLPRCRLSREHLPGFVGEVSTQCYDSVTD